MAKATILIPTSVDPNYDTALAFDAAAKILADAGFDVVEPKVGVYSTSPQQVARAIAEAASDADLIVLTPSATAEPLGAALEKLGVAIGVPVRNIRKIAIQSSGYDIDPAGELAQSLRECGHVVRPDGKVYPAFKAGVALSQAQAETWVEDEGPDEDSDGDGDGVTFGIVLGRGVPQFPIVD